MNSIGNSLYIFVVLTLGMLEHGINWRKLFRAFGATEVFSLLVMMENDLIFETFFTVEAKRFKARHISLFPSHRLSLIFNYKHHRHHNCNSNHIITRYWYVCDTDDNKDQRYFDSRLILLIMERKKEQLKISEEKGMVTIQGEKFAIQALFSTPIL